MPRSNRMIFLGAGILAAMLGGCSEYLQNSERISLTSGEAIAVNRASMVVDPWPPASAQRNIAFSGSKMQTAMERYRNNQVYQPQGMGTSGTYQPPQANNQNNSGPVGPTLIQPAAAVK